MKKALAILAASAAIASSGASTNAMFETRAFLLDLARQTETVEFVNAYVDKAADAGFNTMLVYLKGVMRTKTFHHVPPERSYSPEQIRKIVEHAAAKGVEVVPYLSLLGHGEPYFTYPELEPLCEERDGARRWADLPKATFCLSKPETRAFLEAYFAEIAEAFPGRNFHVGMDETWNMGFCELCAPRREKAGFGGLYTEFVRWAHGLCARHGRRMWMWDDFYEFFPEELKNVPRDVVMCHWDYDSDVSLHGGRGKFLNRIRRDWLAEYDRLGMDAIVCSWLGVDNIRALTDYAMRHRVKGAMLTQWEMGRCFWGTAIPKLYAAGRLWSDRAVADDKAGDFLDFGVRKAFPLLSDSERHALGTLLRAPRAIPKPGAEANLGRTVDWQRHEAETLALQTLERCAYKAGLSKTPSNPLEPCGLMDDIATEWKLRSAVPVFRKVVPMLTDPKRTASDVRSAKKAVAELRPVLVKAAEKRREQERLWRNGCWPNEQAAKADALVAYCDKLLATPEVAAKDEWRLELCLHLPDFHGIPRWTVEALCGREWLQIAKGSWKPGGDGANFTRYVPFKSAVAPERVRVTYCGNGAAGLNCIALENSKTRLVPRALLKVQGDVADADNLLVDSYEPTTFGIADRRASFHDPALAEKTSSVTMTLGPASLTGPYLLDVTMDRTPAIYKVGETARATVRITEAGRPVGGKTAVCSWNYANTNRIEIAKEGTTIELKLDRPGQVLLRGDLYDGAARLKGVSLKARNQNEGNLYIWAGALFEPEKIRMERARPADFDAYWDGELARMKREAPLSSANVVVKEVKSDKRGFRVFDVTIPGLPPRPTCGYLVVPEGAREKSLPALVMFQGAGSSRATKEYHAGAMFFCINPHGVGNEVPYAEWKAYFDGDGKGYQYSGWDDRGKCFFHGQALRAARGLEWLKTRPEWNGRDLAVKGVSMGGSQSIQAAALDPDVTLCMPRDPALCDHAGFISSTRNRSGWPWILYSPRKLPALQGEHDAVDPVLLANSDYFDNVFFASRIKCPVFLATGLSDDVCFAEGVFKMYNALKGPKDFETNAHAIHCGTTNPRAEAAFRAIVATPPDDAPVASAVDFRKPVGPVKPVNGVGQPPLIGYDNVGMFRYLKEAGIPYSRLHDVGGAFGKNVFVDIPNLFRDFDADENDPASYDFVFTDHLLKSLVENGVEPYFRLGVTIENAARRRAYRVFPPKDFAKWARICEHVIRHYTEGWADGFKFNISHWEIWNEPDGFPTIEQQTMWKAPFSEYVRFYGVVSRHLKAKFPHLKIGGYAGCGFYGVASSWGRPDDARVKHLMACFTNFLDNARSGKMPLDFFSFHCYDQPEFLGRQIDYCRRTLDAYGFAGTEMSLNEWLPGGGIKALGTPRQAAQIAAMLAIMQNGPVDDAEIYDARCGVGAYSPLFNCLTREPFKAYRVYLAFNELRKLGTAVRTTVKSDGLWACAARSADGSRGAVFAANPTSSPIALPAVFGAGGAVRVRAIDADRDLADVPIDTAAVAPETVLLLEYFLVK